MAYESGSTTSASDFLTKLRTFLAANGWTVQGTGDFIASKGLCHVFFGVSSYTEINYYVTSTKETRTISTFRMGLGTSAGDIASINSPTQMPGASGGTVVCNQGAQAGQFSSYHFFTDESGNFACTYIVLGDRHHHFGFGELDKRGLTHAGAAFCTAQNNIEYNVGNAARTEGNSPQMRPGYGGGSWLSETGTYKTSGGQTQVRMSDAVPIGRGFPEGDRVIDSGDMLAVHSNYNHGTNGNSFKDNAKIDLLDAISCGPVLPYGNATPMLAVPIFVRSTGNKMVYIGDIPMHRRLRIAHLNSGDELTIGGDVWKTFPQFRKTNPASIDTALTLTSGYFGFAFKKVL
jgi:hypothetical protein